MSNPKLFISYSWSSPSHEEWVLTLATELRQSGVDVILDKWDLKEGHDAVAFMEKMVSDPAIGKVLMIVDRAYAEKADIRAGGVGTEAQIISKEVYEQQQQDKFVAIVLDKKEDGKPYLPVYYRSRIYIDFTESEKYAENLEKIIRWVFNKPLNEKPEIGRVPEYILSDSPTQLSTSVRYKRAIEAIKGGRPNINGCVSDYLENFAQELEKFRIQSFEGEFDDEVLKNIGEFIPYRNEFLDLIIAVLKYCNDDEIVSIYHSFFEKTIPYMFRPDGVGQYSEWDWDNFKFIVHELFLFTIATFLKYEKFEHANHLMERQYYTSYDPDNGRNVLRSYAVFQNHLDSLNYRNKRLELKRASLHADWLKERSSSSGIEFRHIMQADFILFIRAEIINSQGWGNNWWPETLLYAGRHHGALEIFARAVSKKYFERIRILLTINEPSDLKPLLDAYANQSRRVPRWDFTSVNPAELMGYDALGTKP